MDDLQAAFGVPRDPTRLYRIMALLIELWADYPDWRLGQLVSNAQAAAGHLETATFNVEDTVIERGLLVLLKGGDAPAS